MIVNDRLYIIHYTLHTHMYIVMATIVTFLYMVNQCEWVWYGMAYMYVRKIDVFSCLLAVQLTFPWPNQITDGFFFTSLFRLYNFICFFCRFFFHSFDKFNFRINHPTAPYQQQQKNWMLFPHVILDVNVVAANIDIDTMTQWGVQKKFVKTHSIHKHILETQSLAFIFRYMHMCPT